MIDGLEKASSGLARRTLSLLERLRGEASVVVVVPLEIATGPAAAVLQDYHLTSIGPVVVSSSVPMLEAKSLPGDNFMFEVAARRLGVASSDIGKAPEDTTSIAMRHCIVTSGGLIRTFLQLLQKAALYGVIRGRATPDSADVSRAAEEQTNFLLRLLKDGDAVALRQADDTSGTQIDIERRVRFLANGLLLEYPGRIVRIAPLLSQAIKKERVA